MTGELDLAGIIVDEMVQFVAILDPAGTVLGINRSALEAVGATREQVIGRPFWETPWWTASTELQDHIQSLIRRAAAGEFVQTELRHYGAGGQNELIDVDFSLKPVLGPSGQVAYLIPEGRDITEKKRAEKELAHRNEELRHLNSKLKEFDELKTQFFANVSHELRTPLSLILGPAEKLLASPNLPPFVRADLQMLERNTRILLRLVNELLDVTKLEAGSMQIAYARIDLSGLVRQATANFDAIAQENRIHYTVTAPPHLEADIDPEKIQRILLNLISNAFKFTPRGGSIQVVLSASDSRTASVEVIDSGPGVPVEQRERIFERFYQVEGGTTRRVGGTGLGLAIAQDFARQHGGDIVNEEAPGGGALFRVRLPLAAPSGLQVTRDTESAALDFSRDAASLSTAEFEMEAKTQTAVEADAPATPDRANRPLVLVIEDNPDMNRFVSEALTTQYRVARAFDGQEGLEKSLTLRPDVIVSDVMMPRLGGDELVQAIRRHLEMDATPVILLTAKTGQSMRIDLLEHGAQDYLQKPFLVAELRARVANWIEVSRARKVLQTELASNQQDVAELAAELIRRKRDLGVTLEAVQVAKDEAEAANLVKTDFLNLVSHELRSPLSTLHLQLQLLRYKQDELPASCIVPFQRLTNASARLQKLLDSLLEYARLRSGRVTIVPSTLDLEQLAAEIIDELLPQAQEKGLTLVLRTDGALPALKSNPEILRHVLSNLIGNAVKYTQQGGITVALTHRNGAHEIAVIDSGPGIAENQQAIVFQPFEQLGAIKHKHQPGFGLGLAIAKEMTGLLGGRIELHSRVGHGSTFTVILGTEGEG